MVRAMGILDTDGNLVLLTFKAIAYASHINADYLACIIGDSA